MRYNPIIRIAALALIAGATACGDFLDTVPDNRTEIDTETKLGKLVASAYPRANYAVNFNARVDFVSDKGYGYHENLSNTDAFYWRDVASTAQDSPDYFWSACYTAIAHANEAVAAGARIATEGAVPFVAEARIARAFSHFLLVTTFARFYDPATDNASPGVPYITEPEDIVIKQYDRSTVAKTYEKIEQDLLWGLENLGSDAKYKVPRYHFNLAAANAFAARYYLFKGDFAQAAAYATNVIPEPSKFVDLENGARNVAQTDAAGVYALNNFQPWLTDYASFSSNEIKAQYTKAENKSNLLLSDMVSSLANYANSWRYACMKDDINATVSAENATGGKWAYKPYYASVHWYVPKFRAIFVKSSVNANSGTYYIILPLLRNEEALLTRAEAEVHLNQPEKAVADMNVFARQRIKTYNEATHCLTVERIHNFYKKQVADPALFLNKYDPYGTASWTDERKALLLFVLDCRRNEFMWEGLRYWDMWRYRIPITHTTREGVTNTLLPGDDRWMLQIPQEASLSGVAQNPRSNLLTPEW